MTTKNKRVLSSIGAVIVAFALLVGGTYAFTQFDHRSNRFRTDPNYQARLVEDYEEKEWEVDIPILKEVSVRNMGGTAQFPGRNWGDIFVRLKLKEHMDITPVSYVYYPGDQNIKTRFMTDKNGYFVRFPAGAETVPNLDSIRASTVWADVIHDAASRTAFTSALQESDFIKVQGYFDNQPYWYLVTKEGDPNGQYGSFVVEDRLIDIDRRVNITPSERAEGINYGEGLVHSPSEYDNDECLYPAHLWDALEPHICDLDTHFYTEWKLGESADGSDSWIMFDDWDGDPIKKWILDPATGWATWGDALTPGEQTDLLLESVTPLRMPDGQMLYVIHACMQATNRFEMHREDFWYDDDGNPDEWVIRDTFSDRPTSASGVTIIGGDRTVVAGDSLQLTARVRPVNATNRNVSWSSSNPSVATVDADGNVTAVGEGTAVITVKTDDGGHEDSITVTIVPDAIPVDNVTIDVSAAGITIAVGQELDIPHTITPSNTTYQPSWTSDSAHVAVVNQEGRIRGNSVGSGTVTLSIGGKTATVNVNVVPPTPDTLSIDAGAEGITIVQGTEMNIPHTILPPNTNYVPQWSSSNANVTIVNQQGRIRGNAVGQSVVTLTVGDKSVTVNVEVVAQTHPATGVTMNTASPMTIEVGQTLPISYTVTPANTTDSPTVTSNNANVAVASPTSITGVTPGQSVITVRYNATTSATITVNVVPATPETLSIDVGAEGITITQGAEMNIPHTILPPNTNYVPQWTSSNANVTIVNQQGRIRGAAIGTSIVTLAVGDKSVEVTVNVVADVPPNIPLKEGPFGTVSNPENWDLDRSVRYGINSWDFDNPYFIQRHGAIPLSDILADGFDASNLSIASTVPAGAASKISIEESDGVPSIVIKYYGTQDQWESAPGRNLTELDITLVLSAPGYSDTTISIKVTYFCLYM